jgi:hypothetical protein
MVGCGRVPIGVATVRADARVSRLNSKKLKIVRRLFMGIFGLRRAQQGVDLDSNLQLKFKLSFCCDSGKKPLRTCDGKSLFGSFVRDSMRTMTRLVGLVHEVGEAWRRRRPRHGTGMGVLGSGWRRSPLDAGVSGWGAGPGGESWAARGKQKRERRGGLRQIPAR